MPRALRWASLLLLGLAPGCDPRQVVLTVTGAPRTLRALHATVTLDGREAQPLTEFPGDATTLGLSLPRGGRLTLELDGLSADRCSVARAATTVSLDETTTELTLALLRLQAPSCCSAAGWCWENPLPTGADLRRVWGATAKDLWLAGDGGALFRLNDRTLTPVSLPTTAALLALGGTSTKDVWVGGESGALFHFDGVRFSPRETGTRAPLVALHAIAANDVWVAASDTLLRFDGKTWQRLGPGGVLALWASGSKDVWGVSDRGAIVHYDGASLTTATPLGGRRLNGVWGSGPRDVWAVGSGGAVLHFDGTAWSTDAMAGPTWLAVGGSGPKDIWAVGESASQHFDGTSWQAMPIGPAATLYGVFGGPTGMAGVGPVTVGSVGTVRRFEAGAWVLQSPAPGPLSASESLRAVWGATPDDLWAVGGTGRSSGAQGLIVHHDGVTWSRAMETPAALRDLAGGDPTGVGPSAYAVGDAGTLLRLQAGRWTALATRTDAALRGVWADASGAEVWAVGAGGVVLRGRDGIVAAVPSGTGRDLFDAWGSEAGDIWIVGAGGLVLRGTDGVLRPEPRAEDAARGATLRAVWGTGPDDVWAAGQGGILLHRKAGQWSAELSGATEDLHRLFGTGPGDVWAAGGDEAPPGRNSVLLHFEGQTWARVATGTGRLALFGLFGIPGPLRRVWAVGESGGVLRRRGY